jgi:hypothetical protein
MHTLILSQKNIMQNCWNCCSLESSENRVVLFDLSNELLLEPLELIGTLKLFMRGLSHFGPVHPLKCRIAVDFLHSATRFTPNNDPRQNGPSW